ncbi:MAG: hypothetical protein M5R40_08075 [Anaerolineae bacterium]|nr:hypothetical protein [Anaerolineae bacterium]
MRKRVLLLIAVLLALTAFVPAGVQAAPSSGACWGQATRVFAQMGEMGEHASTQPTPRLGLRNLARALAADGIIPDDSMQALGAFVAAELGLSIDACL